MELDSVIYHFASKKITLLLWAQVRPLLGSEAKRTTPLCPGSQMLAFLCCRLCCLQEGAATGVPLCQHYRGPLCVRGGLLLVGLAFTPAVGSWVLALGTLNPTSGHCPSSQAKYLCCFICCPGPRPHQAKDCPHSTNGRLRQLCQRPLNSWGHQTIVNLFWRLGCIYVCSYYIKYLLLHEAATKRHHSKPILFTVFSNTALTTNSARFIKIPNKLVISKKKKNNINIMVNFITHS